LLKLIGTKDSIDLLNKLAKKDVTPLVKKNCADAVKAIEAREKKATDKDN
jgi:hypothetical protein